MRNLVILENRLDVPERELRRIAAFAALPGLGTVEARFQRCPRGPLSGDTSCVLTPEAMIWVRIGSGRHFPHRQVHGADSATAAEGYQNIGVLRNPMEALVYVLAHELRHVWQLRRGGKEAMDEADADAWALNVLCGWRN